MNPRPVKATILDDDKFALLAIPFGGPIPSPHSPRGVDLDGEWFDERTDIKADWYDVRLVDWHHGHDQVMGRTVIGKADNLRMEETGWWVDVWVNHGNNRLNLVKQLAERGAQLFGSSESLAELVQRDGKGHITQWPYVRQTLSTSPQNTYSVVRSLKAVLDGTTPTAEFWSGIEDAMRDLGTDLRLTSQVGDDRAKAGRVFSAANERDLRNALAAIEQALENLQGAVQRQPQYGPAEGPDNEQAT